MTCASSHSLRLRFFDLDVVISSPDERILEPFQRLYSSFILNSAGSQGSRLFSVVFNSRDYGSTADSLILDGEEWPISRAMCSSGAIYEFILKNIYEKIQSHLLIHASAVRIGGAALMFVGNSGFGKSTLALALARRGAEFLSDEVGAINRVTRNLEAFPRRLRVHQKSLDLAGIGDLGIRTVSWYGKQLLDIADIPGTTIAGPTPLKAVVLLDGEPSLAGKATTDESMAVEFLLDRNDAVLAQKVAHFPGVDRLSCEESEGFTTLRIEGQCLGSAVVQIEAYCRERRICVMDAAPPVAISPTFLEEATLTSVESKHALGTLVQQFLPGRGSVILKDEYQGQSPRLLLEMIRLFRGVPFYRLLVGEMSQMIGLVERLAYDRDSNDLRI